MRIPPWRLDRWLCEWVAPLVCIACALRMKTPADERDDYGFCDACSLLVDPTDERVDNHLPFAGFQYGGPLRDAITRLKYGGASEVARPLGRMLAMRLGPGLASDPRPLVIVPVPLHQKRLSGRGYNQSALIARALGQSLGVRVFFDSLFRLRATTAQVGLSRAERAANMRGSFALGKERQFDVQRTRVLLLDDVVTTGATLDEARKPFLDAGAEVLCIALARSDD